MDPMAEVNWMWKKQAEESTTTDASWSIQAAKHLYNWEKAARRAGYPDKITRLKLDLRDRHKAMVSSHLPQLVMYALGHCYALARWDACGA